MTISPINPRNGKPVDAVDAMKTVFDMWMRNNDRIAIPDWVLQLDGFRARLSLFTNNSVICGEEAHDEVRSVTWYCSDDSGHQGAHFGGRQIGVTEAKGAER